MTKKTNTERPFVSEDGKRTAQVAASDERGKKTSRTIQKKKADAVRLDAAPFGAPSTSGFVPIPKQGARIVTGQEASEEAKEQLQRLKHVVSSGQCAFAITETDNEVRLPSTLSKVESALTIAILHEFVTQSRRFEEVFANKSDERALVPIGQNAEDLPEELVSHIFAKFHVTPREIYLDDKFRICTEVLADDGGLLEFSREDGVRLRIMNADEVDGVETFYCFDKENASVRTTVKKHAADKFIFVNWNALSKKYFKKSLSSGGFGYFATLAANLGKKNVVLQSDETVRVVPFFSTFFDVAEYGGQFFSLIKLEAPIFEDVERRKNNYIKLPENVEEFLASASDVEIRLAVEVANWRTEAKNRKKKKCDLQMTARKLFEKFGTPSDVEQRRFATFWPKLRSAFLRLEDEHEILYCTVNGQKLTADTLAKQSDKVAFGVNTVLERHAPDA